MPDFNKILIANRGEIAIRIMRAANEMGKKTVAVFAEEDKLGLHRFKADEAYRIGHGMGPVAAYLSINEIIRVARDCGADAIRIIFRHYREVNHITEIVEWAFEQYHTKNDTSDQHMVLFGSSAGARGANEAHHKTLFDQFDLR